MGCHTWFYTVDKKIKYPNRHIALEESLKSTKRWLWKYCKDDKNLIHIISSTLSIKDLEDNPEKYSKELEEYDKGIQDEIDEIKERSYKDLFYTYTITGKEFNGRSMSNCFLLYRNKVYIDTNFDHPFRVYGYPYSDKKEIEIKSYKAFRRFLINSYNNGKLEEDKRKKFHGVIEKLPTKGEWNEIRRCCKGLFIITFG